MNNIEPTLIKKKELANRLSVSPRTIDNWVAKRIIPFIRVGPRFYLYDFEAVLAAIRKHYEVKPIVRILLLAAAAEQSEEDVHGRHGERGQKVVTRRGMKKEEVEKERARLRESGSKDLQIAKAVRCRVRYFTDGAVIGSRGFVDGIFRRARERFGPKREDGARRPRGALGELKGALWSLRDLKVP